jgi:hypothetical protein
VEVFEEIRKQGRKPTPEIAVAKQLVIIKVNSTLDLITL